MSDTTNELRALSCREMNQVAGGWLYPGAQPSPATIAAINEARARDAELAAQNSNPESGIMFVGAWAFTRSA